MAAYYNEIDPYCAQWLRNLIAAGHIAPGDVDTRSIVDVKPDDLKGYSQCHFFAGIGGWSLALRLAGVPDDRSLWTGSCPCQPFSAAGKGQAADDERHLAPAWLSLIRECRPARVYGEQVEAAIGWGWLDFVFDALEKEGYACGAAVLPACGVGAPHIRQRLYFVADSERGTAERLRLDVATETCGTQGKAQERKRLRDDIGNGGEPVRLAHDSGSGRNWRRSSESSHREIQEEREPEQQEPERLCDVGEGGALAHPVSERGRSRESWCQDASDAWESGETRGFWQRADWLPCIDGKARPVEPGTFPLATRVPARVGKLRAYGNAIVPQVAEAFIRASMTAITSHSRKSRGV